MQSLRALLNEIKTASTVTEVPAGESWDAMIERTQRANAIHKIREETFEYFLGVLPPRWIGHGGFAFAEGEEPWQLFWQHAKSDFRTRSLTWDETRRFCQACHRSTRDHF